MARIVRLDSGPLGLAAMPSGKPSADACHAWLLALEASAAEVIIPAVIDYEVRRELVRISAGARLRNLDILRTRIDDVPVSEAAWDRAAEFSAIVRNAGLPTAGPLDLDADCILAGIASTAFDPSETVIVAKNNVSHLGRFPGIDARTWATIT